MDAGWSIVLALAATVLFGVLLGLVNGLLITKLRISFLVVTLGTLSIYQSFALVVNDGQTITVFGKPGFSVLSDFVNNEIGPFPILLIFDLGPRCSSPAASSATRASAARCSPSARTRRRRA